MVQPFDARKKATKRGGKNQVYFSTMLHYIITFSFSLQSFSDIRASVLSSNQEMYGNDMKEYCCCCCCLLKARGIGFRARVH
jgi:hypothetical protein